MIRQILSKILKLNLLVTGKCVYRCQILCYIPVLDSPSRDRGGASILGAGTDGAGGTDIGPGDAVDNGGGSAEPLGVPGGDEESFGASCESALGIVGKGGEDAGGVEGEIGCAGFGDDYDEVYCVVGFTDDGAVCFVVDVGGDLVIGVGGGDGFYLGLAFLGLLTVVGGEAFPREVLADGFGEDAPFVEGLHGGEPGGLSGAAGFEAVFG